MATSTPHSTSLEQAKQNLDTQHPGRWEGITEVAKQSFVESVSQPRWREISPEHLIKNQGYIATPTKISGFGGVKYTKPAYGESTYAYQVKNQPFYGETIEGTVMTLTIDGVYKTGILRSNGITPTGEFVTKEGTFILLQGGEFIGPISEQYLFDHAIYSPDIRLQTLIIHNDGSLADEAYQWSKPEHVAQD